MKTYLATYLNGDEDEVTAKNVAEAKKKAMKVNPNIGIKSCVLLDDHIDEEESDDDLGENPDEVENKDEAKG